MKIFKKLYPALIFAVVLVLSLAQIPIAYTTELTAQENTVSFMTDVVGLDMAKYAVELSDYSTDDSYNDYEGLVEEIVIYTLESAERKTQALVRFVNDTIVLFRLYELEGSSLPSLSGQRLPTNTFDVADAILQRLQAYSGGTHMSRVKGILLAVALAATVPASAATWTIRPGRGTCPRPASWAARSPISSCP